MVTAMVLGLPDQFVKPRRQRDRQAACPILSVAEIKRSSVCWQAARLGEFAAATAWARTSGCSRTSRSTGMMTAQAQEGEERGVEEAFELHGCLVVEV
jgi:hypothetical protein